MKERKGIEQELHVLRRINAWLNELPSREARFRVLGWAESAMKEEVHAEWAEQKSDPVMAPAEAE